MKLVRSQEPDKMSGNQFLVGTATLALFERPSKSTAAGCLLIFKRETPKLQNPISGTARSIALIAVGAPLFGPGQNVREWVWMESSVYSIALWRRSGGR